MPVSGVRRHNRSLSRGEWKDCPGGGAKQKLVQGAFTSLSLGDRGIK